MGATAPSASELARALVLRGRLERDAGHVGRVVCAALAWSGDARASKGGLLTIVLQEKRLDCLLEPELVLHQNNTMAIDTPTPLPSCPRGGPSSNLNNNAVNPRASSLTILLHAIRAGRPPLAQSAAKHSSSFAECGLSSQTRFRFPRDWCSDSVTAAPSLVSRS